MLPLPHGLPCPARHRGRVRVDTPESLAEQRRSLFLLKLQTTYKLLWGGGGRGQGGAISGEEEEEAPKGSLIYLHEAALPCCHSVTLLRFGRRSPRCRDALARFRGLPPGPLRSLPSLLLHLRSHSLCLISLGVDYGDGCSGRRTDLMRTSVGE